MLHIIPGPDFLPSPLRVQRTSITRPRGPGFAMSKEGPGGRDEQPAEGGAPAAGTRLDTRTSRPAKVYWDRCDSGGLSESSQQDALQDAVPQRT